MRGTSETAVAGLHSGNGNGNGKHHEMDRRTVECHEQALSDVGLTAADQARGG